MNIILEIRIHANGNITILANRQQTCQHRILMSLVMRQADPGKQGVLLTQPFDQFPCIIAASVINQTNFALRADFFF